MFRACVFVLVALAAACGRDSNAGSAPADPVAAARQELGKMLFFDPRLSGTGKTSCSTCHHADKAWTDGRKTAPKDDGSMNTRNAPTMYSVGKLDRWYWDGRAPSLEKNITAAWKSQNGGDPAVVAKALAAVPGYVAQFQAARLDAPSEQTIVDALATFLRSLNAGNSAFDQWQAGKKDAISVAAQQGYELFKGKAGCYVCHPEPLFTDKSFKNTGLGMDAEKPDPGAGGEKAFNNPNMIGFFKVPTLRDVAVTAPYFHDGSVADLTEAVRFLAGGGREHERKSPELINRTLNDAEIGQLVEFLRTLTSQQQFTPPTLPK
jgi:cytochrome c peroxidase